MEVRQCLLLYLIVLQFRGWQGFVSKSKYREQTVKYINNALMHNSVKVLKFQVVPSYIYAIKNYT